jgi:hypothetical protein
VRIAGDGSGNDDTSGNAIDGKAAIMNRVDWIFALGIAMSSMAAIAATLRELRDRRRRGRRRGSGLQFIDAPVAWPISQDLLSVPTSLVYRVHDGSCPAIDAAPDAVIAEAGEVFDLRRCNWSIEVAPALAADAHSRGRLSAAPCPDIKRSPAANGVSGGWASTTHDRRRHTFYRPQSEECKHAA